MADHADRLGRHLAALAELAEALREELRTEAVANPPAPDRLLSIKVGGRRLVAAGSIADFIAAATPT